MIHSFGALYIQRLSCLRPSARRKRRWLASTFRRFNQEIRGGDAQDHGQCFQLVNGDILRTAFDSTNV